MPRAPRRITAAYLERVTVHYLERYSANRAHLRRLLLKRVGRSARHHGAESGNEDRLREDGAALVDAELDRLEAAGLLDDRQFARDKARAMLRRGSSTRKVQSALAVRGMQADQIAEALEALREESEEGRDPDVLAAWVFARKRRVGPWRRNPADAEGRRKELARIGRAGFHYGLARQIVDADDVASLAHSLGLDSPLDSA